MADRLFTTDALDAQALRDHAREISLDVASFERCMTDPATARRVASDVDLVRTEGLSGLPTVYIAGERFVGFNPDKSGERYAAALERAARGQAPAPRPLPMLGVAALAALLIAWPTRRKADAGPALNRAT